MRKMLSLECDMSLTKIRNATLYNNDFEKLMVKAKEIQNWNYFVDDNSCITNVLLKNKLNKMKRLGCEIIFIDYISLIRHVNHKLSKIDRIGELSKDIKETARRLDIPIVALSQLNRDAENKEPTLANIRNSGELEEDADIVIMLHSDRKERQKKCTETKIIVAKNRNGVCGDIKFNFDKEFCEFKEA